MMQLRIVTPTKIIVDQAVERVRVETMGGSYALLPRHIDFVTSIRPGIVSFSPEGHGERFAGVDQGILVKQKNQVRLAVRRGVTSEKLGSLRETVDNEYRELDERERKAQSSWARLQSDFVRSIVEFEKST